MAVLNREPVFVGGPDINYKAGAVIGPSANTAHDGTGANGYDIYQAPSSYPAWINYVRLKPAGSPAATVARLYIHTTTGTITFGTTNTAANTFMIAEITLPLITSSNTVAQSDFTIPVNRMLAAGMHLIMTFATSTGASGTGYMVSADAYTYAPTV